VVPISKYMLFNIWEISCLQLIGETSSNETNIDHMIEHFFWEHIYASVKKIYLKAAVHIQYRNTKHIW
jgi:hypothetical protein